MLVWYKDGAKSALAEKHFVYIILITIIKIKRITTTTTLGDCLGNKKDLECIRKG